MQAAEWTVERKSVQRRDGRELLCVLLEAHGERRKRKDGLEDSRVRQAVPGGRG